MKKIFTKIYLRSITILTIYFLTILTGYSGTISINNITTVNPTCVNNGSITIIASESAPALGLLYSIQGPINSTNSTGVFNSLPEGVYYVKVFNLANDSAVQNDVTLIALYIPPIIQNAIAVRPGCDNSHDGTITGVLQSGTGFGPFSWRLDTITGGTIRPAQTSANFTDLPIGSYTLVLQDCANTIQYTVIFSPSGNEFRDGFYGNGFPTAERIHCDTFMIRFGINHNLIEYKPPYRLRINTPDGEFWYNHNQITGMQEVSSVWFVSQKVGGLEYGDPISVAFFNACNDSIRFERNITRIEDVIFDSRLNCKDNVNILARIYDSRSNLMTTGLYAPVKFELIDAGTNMSVFSETRTRTDEQILFEQFVQNMIYSINISDVPNNTTYYFQVEDNCGYIFRDTFRVDEIQQPLRMTVGISYPIHCFDSVVGAMTAYLEGFRSQTTFTILSGPATLQSTNPLYSYHDTYTYPIVLPTLFQENGDGATYLVNLAVGTYEVQISDECGNVLDTKIIVEPEDIQGLRHDFNYTRGCGNNNTINFTLFNAYTDNFIIRKLGQGTVFTGALFAVTTPHTIHVPNLSPGIYVVEYTLASNSIAHFLNDTKSCRVIRDTLIISEQSNPEINTIQAALCKNSYVIQVINEPGQGVAPFEYQLLDKNGDFTTWQNEDIFTVADTGSFRAFIRDACGNQSSYNVFVDYIDYNTLGFSGTNCLGDSALITLLYSPYIRYDVIYPNGLVTHENSISINPIMPEDEGWYSIYKYLHIGDCYDTIPQFYYFDVNACTLPVELTKFDATCVSSTQEVIVNWTTASEINNDYYEVELSKDGVHFISVGNVYSKNSTSSQIQNYQFDYLRKDQDLRYCRLKQVDKDTQFTYTKIIEINCDEVSYTELPINIFPNPGNQWITIQTDNKDIKEVFLINAIGQVLKHETITSEQWQWNINQLEDGIYFLKIDQGKAVKFQKVD